MKTAATIPVQNGEKIVATGGPVVGFVSFFRGSVLPGYGLQTLFA